MSGSVDAAGFQSALEWLRAELPDPAAGVFGPGSKVWEINRHAVIFVGAGRAALLQLAHPWVARAIDDHSVARDDPVRRFRRTFIQVFAMVYGDLDQALRAASTVFATHRMLEGPLAQASDSSGAGARYRATDVGALLWVHSTLWETSMQVFELLVRPVPRREKDAYLAETARFARLFGIPDDALPADWAAFERYNRCMWRELDVSSTAAEIATALFRPLAPGLGPLSAWYRVITAGLMPAELRAGFGLRFDRASDRAIFERSVDALRLWPRLPRRLRYLPPYLDALGRLAGRPEPDWLGRLFNRALIGTPKLV